MNNITEITRRDIFDLFTYGILDEWALHIRRNYIEDKEKTCGVCCVYFYFSTRCKYSDQIFISYEYASWAENDESA